MNKHLTVIASGWKKMIARPGLGQRTGKETIVDKAWITEEGKIEHHGPGTTHQEFALRYLKNTDRKFKPTGNVNQDQLRAEDVLLRRGWIRVQVYSFDGLGLQGSQEAISARGYLALQLLPRPRRVYVMIFPENETTLYTAEQLAEIGLIAPGS